MSSQTVSGGIRKERIDILDGMRGVAAVFVVLYHLIETYQNSSVHVINHAYLAVDFFFILSGFVVSYAYDERLGRELNIVSFFIRRFIRLHPMVVFATVLGAVLYCFQDSPWFPLIQDSTWRDVLTVAVMGILFMPCGIYHDIRGWNEMFCLNSPQWTLFYEYIANICYGLFLYRLSNKGLWIMTVLTALLTLNLTLDLNIGQFMVNRSNLKYTVIGGWCWDSSDFFIGFTRLLFPFCCGMLIRRMGWKIAVRHRFEVCAFILIGVFFVPKLPGMLNGIFESCCILLVFPLLMIIGSGCGDKSKAKSVYLLLGRLSYPMYLIHFPIVYLQTAWVSLHPSAGLAENIVVTTACFLSILMTAHFSYKYYETPVRRRMVLYVVLTERLRVDTSAEMEDTEHEHRRST